MKKRGGEKVKAEEIKKIPHEKVKQVSDKLLQVKKEVGKIIVGQEEVINSLLRAILCEGHVLIEGVPGVAKTLIIKTLGQVTGAKVKRIQFTVDLLPSDIVGITTYSPQKGFEIIKGPIFANFVIADELNRAPPKTQSALLEAMQEKQVTIGKNTFKISPPFFVMATQNPLESSGVYSLPEAQTDRFLFKILMKYPQTEEEYRIMEKNTTTKDFEDFKLKPVISPEEIIKIQQLVKEVYINSRIKKYILDIVAATRNKELANSKYIEWGASPRASIALFIASKANAIMQNRNFVIPKDVKDVAHEILRHRMILSYKAGAEGVTSDKIIEEILNKTPVP